eukprot:12068876-Ditylum_brightwellii.AAC.1
MQHQNHDDNNQPTNNPDLHWVDMSDGKTIIIEKEISSFLDMALLWDNNRNLQFGIYRQQKQVLKYVDTDSTLRPT